MLVQLAHAPASHRTGPFSTHHNGAHWNTTAPKAPPRSQSRPCGQYRHRPHQQPNQKTNPRPPLSHGGPSHATSSSRNEPKFFRAPPPRERGTTNLATCPFSGVPPPPPRSFRRPDCPEAAAAPRALRQRPRRGRAASHVLPKLAPLRPCAS